MSKKIFAIAIALFLISAIIVPLYALPTADAQTTDWVTTYPFVIPIDNPVGVGQECLLWFGITDMCVWPQTGWKDLTITETLPDDTTETLSHLNTDTTGGGGTTYIPTMEGTYYFQVHFPEQVNEYGDPSRPYPLPAGTIMKASDSEKVPLTVQQDPVPQHPGFPLPTEYWVRPINAQFREWASISGSYVFDGLPFTTNPDSLFQPYNEAPDTAHILWRRQDVLGGLVGGDSEITRFDDGTAYESKWHAVIVGGILLYDAPWPTLSHYQGVTAVDLRTGEELWFKEGIRVAFGQLMCWDTQDMHAVFGYFWEVQGSTWKAYDVYSGEWWFTMTNVPSGSRMVGPAGEILVYTVNQAKGWMTLWNSTNVPFLYGADDPNNPAVFPYYWGTWRPYGKTVNATGPFPITSNTLELPTGYAGYMWNKTIPTGLPGSVRLAINNGTLLRDLSRGGP